MSLSSSLNSHYEKFLATGEVKCIDDEIPFEIPDGWEWVRLSSVSIIQEGPGIRSYQYKLSGIQLLTVTNILEGSIDLDKSRKYISEKEYEAKYLHFQLNKGDIICACSGGSWGKSALVEFQDIKIILNTSTLRLRFFNDKADNQFLYHLTKSDFFKLQLQNQLSGIQPNFGYAHYSKILIPLPPLKEQHRIVSRIEELLPFLNLYGSSQNKLDTLNQEIIIRLKKSILQESIQGRLVPQDPSDEPASELLKRIREEKLRLFKEGKLKKKDITDSVIFKGDDNRHYEKIGNAVTCIENEIPFDIPDSWSLVRLRNICSIMTGATFKKEDARHDNQGIRVLRGGNILPFEIKSKDDDIFLSPDYVKKDILLKQNDLITPAVTSLENICKMARAEKDMPTTTVGGFVFILRPYYDSDSISTYLLETLSSPSLIEFVKSITNKSGQAFYNIGKERLGSALIPLPPIKEQERINDRIELLWNNLR